MDGTIAMPGWNRFYPPLSLITGSEPAATFKLANDNHRGPTLAVSLKGSSMKPLAVTIKQVCELTGVGRTTVYKLAQEGRIRFIKVGRRTLVSMACVENLLRDGAQE